MRHALHHSTSPPPQEKAQDERAAHILTLENNKQSSFALTSSLSSRPCRQTALLASAACTTSARHAQMCNFKAAGRVCMMKALGADLKLQQLPSHKATHAKGFLLFAFFFFGSFFFSPLGAGDDGKREGGLNITRSHTTFVAESFSRLIDKAHQRQRGGIGGNLKRPHPAWTWQSKALCGQAKCRELGDSQLLTSDGLRSRACSLIIVF